MPQPNTLRSPTLNTRFPNPSSPATALNVTGVVAGTPSAIRSRSSVISAARV